MSTPNPTTSSDEAIQAAAAAAAAGAVAAAAGAAAAHHHHLGAGHSHEDYDWMGVLDTLAGDQYLTAGGQVHLQHHQQQQYQQHLQQHGAGGGTSASAAGAGASHEETAAAMAAAASVVDEVMASSATSVTHASANRKQPAVTVHTMALPPTIAIPESCTSPKECDDNNCDAPSCNNGNSSDTKKQSRIERKRSREKQRRLDTNSQFTALAEIVREVETIDFVEEAQYNLTTHYGGGVGGINGMPMPASHGAEQQQQQLGGKSEHDAASAPGAPPPLPSTSPGASTSHDNDHNPNSNKKLKSQESSSSSTCPSATAAAAGAGVPISALTGSSFNPSNRVDLIARTISQLTQFRMIRRRRTEQLRDGKRQLCEVRKEVEGLRRLVAHYKAVGMGGGQKPQEKVMMMVPMMVPQDAVSQIAQGYPAAHQYGNTPGAATANPHHFAAAAPWMAGMHGMMAPQPHHAPHTTTTTNMGLTSTYHHPGAAHAAAAAQQGGMAHVNVAAAPGAPAPAPPPAGGQHAPSPGVMTLPPHLAHIGRNGSVPPSMYQPFPGHLPAPTGAPGGVAPPHPNAPSPCNNTSPSPHATMQAPTHGQQLASSYASALQTHQQQHPGNPNALMPPPAPATQHHPAPAMAMYPQVSNGIPSVAFGLHPHPPPHAPSPVGVGVNLHSNPHGNNAQGPSAVVAGAPGAGPPVQQPPHGNNNGPPVQQQQPSSDKPTAPAQMGGGGNLAHCA